MSAPAAVAPLATCRTVPSFAEACPPRLDLYGPLHKGLRACLCAALLRVAQTDGSDLSALALTLAEVEALLQLCRAHLEHEEAVLHPAIEARLPGGARRSAEEHQVHRRSFEALRAQLQAVREAGAPAACASALRQLHARLALFVAENLEHMHIEETVNQPALWATCDDAELQALHERLLAAPDPDALRRLLYWMLPALGPLERAGLLQQMRCRLVPPAFESLLDLLHLQLRAEDWRRLCADLGLDPQPLAA